MKTLRNKILSFVVAFMLMLGAGATAMVSTASAESTVDAQGSMIYNEEVNIDFVDNQTTYSVDVKAELKVGVASYYMQLVMPYFIDATEVICSEETAKNGDLEYGIDKNIVNISYTSSEDKSGNVNLFTINFIVPRPGNYSGCININDSEVTNTSFQYVEGFAVSFGSINVSYQNGGGEITYLKGDMDYDGDVDLQDVLIIQRSLVNSDYALDGIQYNNADINCDGNVNTMDCQYIRMYIAGALDSLENIGGEETGKSYTFYVHIFDQNGNGMGDYRIMVKEGGDLYGAVKQKCIDLGFDLSSAYYNGESLYEGIGFYGDGEVTAYVNVSSSQRMITIVKMVREPDGNISTCGENVVYVREGELLHNILKEFMYMDGMNYIGVYADQYMKAQFDDKIQVYEDTNVYLFFENNYVPEYETCYLKIVYMGVSENNVIEMDWSSSSGAIKGQPLADCGNDRNYEQLYTREGVYFDREMTMPVGDAILENDTVVYVKFILKDITGDYTAYQVDYDENGNPSTKEVGIVTLSKTTATLNGAGEFSEVVKEGEYVVAGQTIVVVMGNNGEYVEQYVFAYMQEGMLALAYSFDGSDYKTTEEFKEISGTYVVNVPNQDSCMITLLDKGIYNMDDGGVIMVGPYTFSENVLILYQSGHESKAIYDPQTNEFTAVIEQGGGSDQPSIGAVNADGVYKVRIESTSTFMPPCDTVVVEGNRFEFRTTDSEEVVVGDCYFMNDGGDVCGNFFVSEYQFYIVSIDVENSTCEFNSYFDAEYAKENEALSSVAGVYSFYFSDAGINFNVTLLTNGIAILEGGGIKGATYYSLNEDGTISIIDIVDVTVDFENKIMYEVGSNSDKTEFEYGDYQGEIYGVSTVINLTDSGYFVIKSNEGVITGDRYYCVYNCCYLIADETTFVIILDVENRTFYLDQILNRSEEYASLAGYYSCEVERGLFAEVEMTDCGLIIFFVEGEYTVSTYIINPDGTISIQGIGDAAIEDGELVPVDDYEGEEEDKTSIFGEYTNTTYYEGGKSTEYLYLNENKTFEFKFEDGSVLGGNIVYIEGERVTLVATDGTKYVVTLNFENRLYDSMIITDVTTDYIM